MVGDADRPVLLAGAKRRERWPEHPQFSEWDKPQAELDEVIGAVQSGSMAPIQYKLFHGDARLSDTERQQLVDGLKQLYATDPPSGTKHEG
jgi:heme-binding protein